MKGVVYAMKRPDFSIMTSQARALSRRLFAHHRQKTVKVLGLLALTVGAIIVTAPAAQTVYSTAMVGKRKLPIYSVETQDKKAAITFDAAWGAEDTDTLLKILKDNNVRATFFLCGYWVDKYPEESKRIFQAGHDVGNHSSTHAHGAHLSLGQNTKEIQDAHDKVKSLLGIDMNLYRPPFGEYNNTVISAALDLNYYPIQWDVDSLDWKEYGLEKEIDTVLNHKNLRNGSIILFHNDAKFTPNALEPIIRGMREKGFSLVPVSELIYKDGYTIDHTGRQKKNG
jgi:polysaccharide deacetylase family sporulation protein PdaB